ncbi:N-acetyltransferase [Ornithinibacillus halotolerans]|uniref:N-acetyltransferase n=2 Tax=Ornithinibacillus halotolerans TaxID=1274357 RepID=A0A916S6U0_9BACI|nr:N-acetyltransferase [Ornithinibacillus halotolerans]
MLEIRRSLETDLKKLLKIQKEAFAKDLLTYQDYQTSPVNEPLERLLAKINQFLHYTILLEQEIIGGIDIRNLGDGRYRLNRIFLAGAHQNKGFGTHIMQLIENEFPNAKTWNLDTPHLNIRNQHFYEKLGYKKVGEHHVSDKLTLFDYIKEIEK